MKTKVFHGWAESRKMKNAIPSLLDDSGVEITEEEAKGDISVNYFTQSFRSFNPSDAAELLQRKVSASMNDRLIKSVYAAEIKHAVKAIKSDSSPGADGMTGHFYQKYWHIIGSKITSEVHKLFSGGCAASGVELHSVGVVTKDSQPDCNG